MRIGRFLIDGTPTQAEIKDDRVVGEGFEIGLEQARFLPPAMPSKVVCVGLNYRSHARELDMPIPVEPVLFLKPPSAVIGHQGEIRLPGVGQIDYEAELAVVVGQRCKEVQARDADQVILGYTCLNDVTARDIQRRDGQWTRAKSYDTFCPIGPWIETSIDPADVSVTCRVNGEVRQEGSTRSLIFGVGELVEFVSNVMTLEPGDVIATGTPPGVGALKPGDTVEVEVEGIGALRNPVVGYGASD